MSKVIFHIDLNAFFASAEEAMDPSLKDLPVAVSGHSRRSVITTANYLAREYGVRSAMPLQEALELCPQLVVVKGNHDLYEELSRKFIDLIKSYTPLVEQASIDECFADMSSVILNFKRPLDLAWQIQKNLEQELNLKCSIGVAPNKFLAKMASDMKKPMGITVIRKQEVKTKLWPLPISEMQGIGKKTAILLKELNINTIGDLANYKELDRLKPILGKNTLSMIDKSNGGGSDEIIVDHEVKSLSQSTTFLKDITDYTEILMMFRKLASQLEERMKENAKAGYVISISVRYFDFNTIVRSKRLDIAIFNSNDLFEHAISLYDQNETDQSIRHLGIGISSLIDKENTTTQLNLFEEPPPISETEKLLERLNKEVKGNLLTTASSILKKTHK